MKIPSDFKNHDKVLELAKKLDEKNEPLPIFRARKVSQIKVIDNPPKTYTEIAKSRNHRLYKRTFDRKTGSLVKYLYKK
jgi:hypothetical protein